jgi:hypothetical protein
MPTPSILRSIRLSKLPLLSTVALPAALLTV